MSDLLSPILVILDDEVDAFWCFVGFMDHIGVVGTGKPTHEEHILINLCENKRLFACPSHFVSGE